MLYILQTTVVHMYSLTPTSCHDTSICSLIIRHVSILTVGHLQGARNCSRCS